jgi:hypothetical protein
MATRTNSTNTAARLSLVVLVALLAVLGLHGTVGSPDWNGHSRTHEAWAAGALEAAVVALALVVRRRTRRSPADYLVAVRLRIALSYLLIGMASALALTLVVLLVNLHVSARPPALGRAPALHGLLGHPKVAPSQAAGHFPLSQIFYGLAAAILLAAVVVLAVKGLGRTRAPSAPELGVVAEEYPEELHEALRMGQRALLELDDARAAIIACYVAMEESLARAGTARANTETPDELLTRAAGSLAISRAAASRLTSLFYEARFSSHPLLSGQRDAAQAALAELAEDLERLDRDARVGAPSEL